MDEATEAALMRAGAQIERLQRELAEHMDDAVRYRWLSRGGIYEMPYKDHGNGPEFDLSRAAVDFAIAKGIVK